ncbi:MAG TPA: DNA recombination protein RmuC [Candidatus Udaeobacter sp.]|nr:DNA recombination protein RmuC [Candidatus Udaeobacter sp.]
MQNILLILIVLLIAGLIAMLFVVIKKQNTKPKEGEQNLFLMLQNQIQDLNRLVEQKITDTHKVMSETQTNLNKTIQSQFGQSMKIITDVTDRLAKLDETNRQVVSFTDQLQNLQDILKNPKQRGILGEYYLETLLKNILAPGQYQMQYGFKNGEIVDAAVFVKDKIIPVDSKFSLENYNRMIETSDVQEKTRLEKLFVNDLKLRITETAKYIRPEEGTMDFAFMFIPHEAIYYDLLINKIGAVTEDTENLIQRAAGKYKVIIVSPTSFLAYLQTVLQGLKAMQIEETTKDIIKRVGEIGAHLKKYEEYHSKVGSSLGTVVSHFNNSSKEFKKIDKDVVRITGESGGFEAVLIDKPDSEE